MSKNLVCEYTNRDETTTITPLYLSSFSIRYTKNIEIAGVRSGELIGNDNGIKEIGFDVEFLFFSDGYTIDDSKAITDNLMDWGITYVPAKTGLSARQKLDQFENILFLKDGGYLVHPNKGAMSVMVLSTSEKIDFINDCEVIKYSVSFTHAKPPSPIKNTNKTYSLAAGQIVKVWCATTNTWVDTTIMDGQATACGADLPIPSN